MPKISSTNALSITGEYADINIVSITIQGDIVSEGSIEPLIKSYARQSYKADVMLSPLDEQNKL